MVTSADTIERRLWDDAATGQISSDGELVYQVRRPRTPLQDEDDEQPTRPRRTAAGQGGARPGNVLQALSLSGQRGVLPLAWEIDGTGEPAKSPLAGATFLGAPLPMRGVLYVLAEFTGSAGESTSGDTRLLAIDPRAIDAHGKPKLLWSQRVAQFDDALASAASGEFRPLLGFSGGRAQRRQAGLSPSAGDGVVICPTGAAPSWRWT